MYQTGEIVVGLMLKTLKVPLFMLGITAFLPLGGMVT